LSGTLRVLGVGGFKLTQIMAAWGRIAQPVNSAMQQLSLWRKLI
jgi:hypothetical protein